MQFAYHCMKITQHTHLLVTYGSCGHVFVSGLDEFLKGRYRPGIACFRGIIYVVCYRNPAVYVFDQNTLKLLGRLIVTCLEAPRDIAVCVNGSQLDLYIADNTYDDRMSCIWKIDLSGNQIERFQEFPAQIESMMVTSAALLVTLAKGQGERRLAIGHGA
jgi:hypothetical protein